VWFEEQKFNKGLVFMALKSRIEHYLESGYISSFTEDVVWQTLLKKYLGSNALFQVYWKPRNSHLWTGLMAKKRHFFPFGLFIIKDGSEIRIWEDK
jgi:hypothetical protein